MKVVGECGIMNTCEVRRVQHALAKIRTAARHLLTWNEKDDSRTFEGQPSVQKKLPHFGAARAAKHSLAEGGA